MYVKTIAITFFLATSLAHGHEGRSTQTGSWIEEQLTVRHDSNWSTEHCLQLPGDQRIEYRFTADIPLKFDFHHHPALADGGHKTVYLAKKESAQEAAGQADAATPGTYCFDFIPVTRPGNDKYILLAYRID